MTRKLLLHARGAGSDEKTRFATKPGYNLRPVLDRLGSARVSRAGFGVSLKQSSKSPRKPGRLRQHARRVRYPDSLAQQLIQINSFTGPFNFDDHRLKEPCVCRLLRFDVERRFSFRAAQRDG